MKSRSGWIRVCLLAAGIGLLFALLLQIGVGKIVAQLSSVGTAALWLAVPYCAGTILVAIPWGMLLPRHARLRVRALLVSRFAASGANSVLFGIGGEPCRLLWMRASDRGMGLATLIVDRLIYNAANAVFLLGSAVIVLVVGRVPVRYGVIGLAVALAVTLVTALVIWAISSRRFARAARKLVSALPFESRSVLNAGSSLKASLRRHANVRPRRFAACAFMHLAGRSVLAVEVYVALWILRPDVDVSSALVLVCGQVALSAVAAWIPNQIGVHEGGQAALCAALGLDPALGVAAVLLQRVRQAASVGLSPLLIAHVTRMPAAAAVASPLNAASTGGAAVPVAPGSPEAERHRNAVDGP